MEANIRSLPECKVSIGAGLQVTGRSGDQATTNLMTHVIIVFRSADWPVSIVMSSWSMSSQMLRFTGS